MIKIGEWELFRVTSTGVSLRFFTNRRRWTRMDGSKYRKFIYPLFSLSLSHSVWVHLFPYLFIPQDESVAYFFFFPLPPGISIVSALSIVVELCDVTTNEIADR